MIIYKVSKVSQRPTVVHVKVYDCKGDTFWRKEGERGASMETLHLKYFRSKEDAEKYAKARCEKAPMQDLKLIRHYAKQIFEELQESEYLLRSWLVFYEQVKDKADCEKELYALVMKTQRQMLRAETFRDQVRKSNNHQ